MRRLGVALAVAALGLAFAGIAQAGTLSRVDADLLRYDARPRRDERIFRLDRLRRRPGDRHGRDRDGGSGVHDAGRP